MTERMTSVRCRTAYGHPGFADYGRHDPEEMIARLRADAARELEWCQKVIDAPDEDFDVFTYTGVHVRRDGKRLWPREEQNDG